MSFLTIVLATHNKHKRDELAAMLGGEFVVEMLPEDFPDIEETGTTLEENAAIKARAVFAGVGKPVIADDTGLEVAALGGAPGVYSARYAGERATYKDNCIKLLKELDGKTDRNASFKTVLCYIDANGKETEFEGKVDGSIAPLSLGVHGFGYDPIFVPVDGNGHTFSEMTSEEKNRISHRRRAVERFSEWLRGTE
jgi:XTP/dITP diphosphohydrolase